MIKGKWECACGEWDTEVLRTKFHTYGGDDRCPNCRSIIIFVEIEETEFIDERYLPDIQKPSTP